MGAMGQRSGGSVHLNLLVMVVFYPTLYRRGPVSSSSGGPLLLPLLLLPSPLGPWGSALVLAGAGGLAGVRLDAQTLQHLHRLELGCFLLLLLLRLVLLLAVGLLVEV